MDGAGGKHANVVSSDFLYMIESPHLPLCNGVCKQNHFYFLSIRIKTERGYYFLPCYFSLASVKYKIKQKSACTLRNRHSSHSSQGYKRSNYFRKKASIRKTSKLHLNIFLCESIAPASVFNSSIDCAISASCLQC